jgi:hypothetical protein
MPTTVTVFDLISEALAIYGEYAAGETLDASTVQTCLFTLNGALDGLGGEPLAMWQTALLTFATIAGKQSYTLGPSAADWITTAAPPAEITGAGVVTNGLEIPLSLLAPDVWAGLGLKSMASSWPSGVWIQYGPAVHTLNFWPVPSAALSIKLYGLQPIPRFSAQTDVITLPPGYQEFLVYDLAIKTSSKFGADLPGWLPTAWREARTRVKESNYRAIESRLDPALTQRSGGRGVPSIRFYTGQ